MSVHAQGILRFLGDSDLRELLEELTAHFENDEDSPSLFRHLPSDYVDSLVKAIVAFEIQVQNVRHVFKLSQNRDEQSYSNIIRHLELQGGDGAIIASEMRKRRSRLFPETPSDSLLSP